MKVYAYSNCDTCRKALKHLEGGKHTVEVVAADRAGNVRRQDGLFLVR